MDFLKFVKENTKKIYIVLIVVIIFIGSYLTFQLGNSVDTRQRNDLLLRAKNFSLSINQADIKKLSGRASDLDNISYQKLKVMLKSMRELNSDTRFFYLMGIEDSVQFFYVDSEDQDSKDYSPPGQIYEDSLPLDIYNHENGIAYINGPYKDSWGNWISAYAPVVDTESGKVLAMIGIDVDASLFLENIKHTREVSILLTVLIVLILLLLLYLNTSSLNYIKEIEDLNQDLKTSYEYLIQTEKMANVGRFIWNSVTDDVNLNEPLVKLLDLKTSRISTKSFLNFIPFEEVERIKKENIIFLKNNENLKIKYILNSPILGKRKIVSFCKLEQDAKGNILNAVCTVLDITE